MKKLFRETRPELVVGLYEAVKGEGIPKSFPLNNDLEEFSELGSWKSESDESYDVEIKSWSDRARYI